LTNDIVMAMTGGDGNLRLRPDVGYFSMFQGLKSWVRGRKMKKSRVLGLESFSGEV
jgi:hypothetical protein